jgi:hypothetical protein
VLVATLVVAELDAAGDDALVALDEELLPPQAARPPASATADRAPHAPPIDLPHSVPIIITPYLGWSETCQAKTPGARETRRGHRTFTVL